MSSLSLQVVSRLNGSRRGYKLGSIFSTGLSHSEVL